MHGHPFSFFFFFFLDSGAPGFPSALTSIPASPSGGPEQALNLNGVQFGPNEIRVAPKRGHQMQPEAEDVPCPRGVCKLFLKKGMCNRPSCRFQHLTSAQAALLSAADDEELLEPKIWVGNVHSDTTEAELMAFFEEHLGVGVVAKLSTHKNPDGSKRGIGGRERGRLEGVRLHSCSLPLPRTVYCVFCTVYCVPCGVLMCTVY